MSAVAASPPARTRLPLVALLAANGISTVGNMLTLVAVPWFVLQTTGSAGKTGLTGFFTFLPAVIAAIAGGAIVDRLGFRRMSVISDIASGVTVALIPLLYFTVGLEFWQLLVLVFLGALLDTPGTTARQSLLPDLAEAAGAPLERVNAIYQAVQRSSMLVGPPLAGILIATFDASNVLWFDAATFAVSALLIGLTAPGRLSRPAPARPGGGYLAEIQEGIAVVRRSRLLLSAVITVAITNFLDTPIFSVILPVYANEVFGSAVDLGLIVAAFGGGALAGSLAYGAVSHRLPRRKTFILSFILAGLPIWVLAMTPGLPVTIAALAVVGIASGPLNPLIMTILQEHVPAELRGRVFGSVTAMALVAAPLGMVIQGYVVEKIGLGATLLIIAGAYLLVTLSMLVNPAFHDMDRPLTPAEPESMPGARQVAASQ